MAKINASFESHAMSDEEVKAYQELLSSRVGEFISDARLKQSKKLPRSRSVDRVSDETEILSDRDLLVAEIVLWLTENPGRLDQRPRDLAGDACLAFEQPPLTAEELVEFFFTFALASIEFRIQTAKTMIEASKTVCDSTQTTAIPTLTDQSNPFALGLVYSSDIFIEYEALQKLRQLQKDVPDESLVYLLLLFAGCSIEEVAGYLGKTTDEIESAFMVGSYELPTSYYQFS